MAAMSGAWLRKKVRHPWLGGPLRRSPAKHIDLLPQDQVFRFQRYSRLEARSQDTEKQLEQIGHQDASLRRPLAASTPDRIFGTHRRGAFTGVARSATLDKISQRDICVFRVSEGAANSERRPSMALYALQTAYAPVGWATVLKDPQNRMEAVKPVVQRLGGSVVDGWLTFGDYDVLVICQLPDNVSATALSMAISAGGAVRSVKTTPLVTFDEGLEALKKAKDAGYTPPPSEVPYFGVYRGA